MSRPARFLAPWFEGLFCRGPFGARGDRDAAARQAERPSIHPSTRRQCGTAASHKTRARLGLRLCGAAVLLGLLGCRSDLRAENWPAWRGPRGDGTSSETHVPIHWSATSNVVWKPEVPGNGHASPIVWDDRVLTVPALLDSQDRALLSLDRKTR